MKLGLSPVRDLIWFFGLTIGLTYLIFWGPLAVLGVPAANLAEAASGPVWAIPLFILGGFTPSVVGIFLTWRGDGRSGLLKLWRSLTHVRIGWKWYLAILLVVGVGSAFQLALLALLGASIDLGQFLISLPLLIPLFFLGPLSEELGWRGYALDRLQMRWNAAISSLILGVFWGLWHLPLFRMVGTLQFESSLPFLPFLVGTIGLTVLMSWTHNNTERTVWTAVFFHWMYTYAITVITASATRPAGYNLLEFGGYVVMAIGVLLIWGPATLTRTSMIDET